MGKDIDWKETEWLVKQLRAKLEEDKDGSVSSRPDPIGTVQDAPAAEPSVARPKPRKTTKKSERTRASMPRQEAPVTTEETAVSFPPQEVVPTSESVEVSASVAEQTASVVEKAVPVTEQSAPVAEHVAKAVASEQATRLAEPREEKKTEADGAPEISVPDAAEPQVDAAKPQVDAAEPQVDAAEPVSPPVDAAPQSVRKRRMPPPQKRTALFAASYDHEDAVELHPAPVGRKKSAPKVSVPAQLRTEEEMRAEETVEHLMQDLFGIGSDVGWFSKGGERVEAQKPEKPSSTEEKPQLQAEPEEKALPEAHESTSVQPAEATSTQEAAVPRRKKARVSREAAPEQALETITRERDGQMALVLPETGKPLAIPAGESEPHTGKRERVTADEAQINLFSPDQASGREGVLVPTLSDPARDKRELKRSVESSEEDFRLLLELDYEEELGNAIGFEKIRAYHEEGVNGQAVVKRRRRKSTEKREYEVQGQDTTLRKSYTKQKGEHVTRLALSIAFTVLIFIYEQTGWMAALFGGPFDGEKYPASYILIGIQLLIVAAFFSYQRIIEGFWRIVRFSPIDYSLCSVMLIVTLIYHLVLIFLPHEGAPSLYLSPAAMSLALLALADLLDWYRESLAFQVISSRKQKYALIPRVSVGGKQGDARSRLEESDPEGNVWYIRPVGFVRNYFANTEKRVEHNQSLGAQLIMIVAIGLAFGLYTLATGGTATEMLQTTFVTFLLCAPATSLLVTSLPMFLAACLRLGKKGAIVGEEPINACGGNATLVMPDTESFGTMHHERFELNEEVDVHRVAILVRALLEKLQSPLCDSVSVSRDQRISPSLVTLTEIEEMGVTATVGEEKVPLLMGSVEYLQQRGVEINADAYTDVEKAGKRLICVAVEGELCALFLARYRLTDDMRELLESLETENVQVMIRTKDPGIRNDLFATLLPDRKEPVRVMKPSAREMDLRTDRVDATIVALGSCNEAARTFVTCRRVRRAGHVGKLFQGLSVGMGAVLAGLLTLLGGSVTLSSFLVSLYLLFWCGVHAATSYFYLREKNDDQP